MNSERCTRATKILDSQRALPDKNSYLQHLNFQPTHNNMTMLPIPLRTIHQPGLEWDEDGDPAWAQEPSFDIMKAIIRQHLDLEEDFDLSFFAEGALNRLYAFDCPKGPFLMRVTLPVAPRVKTESEIATIAFIRDHTNIPVPKIFAYSADLQNELGFEWIIMERVEARPLFEVWHQLSWLKKQLIVQQLAAYWAQLFGARFSGIGSIYNSEIKSENRGNLPQGTVHIGETVLMHYCANANYELDIDRGPYNSSRNYIEAFLDMLSHTSAKLQESEDEDEVEHGQAMQYVFDGLKKIVPRYFPHHSQREETLLFHRDISDMNILINEEGELASIVDWECVAAVPIWQACELPRLLQGSSCMFELVPTKVSSLEEDHESRNHFYEDRLMFYEGARLRTFFLEEMQRLSPEWMAAFNENRVRRDIMLAITVCRNDLVCSWVGAWVKALLDGDELTVSLTDAIRSPEHRNKAEWLKTRN